MDWLSSEFVALVSNVWWLLVIVGALALFLLNVVFAFRVGADATRRMYARLPIAFGGPVLWFFATLIGSLAAVALYWVFHYSSLRREGEFPASS